MYNNNGNLSGSPSGGVCSSRDGLLITYYVTTSANNYTVSRESAGSGIGTLGATFGKDVEVSNPTAFGYVFDGWTITDMTTDVDHLVDGKSIGTRFIGRKYK